VITSGRKRDASRFLLRFGTVGLGVTGSGPIFERNSMRSQFQIVCAGLFIFALALSLGASSSAPTPAPWPPSAPMIAAATAPSSELSQTSTPTTATSKDVCLDCHGPFDELAKSTTGYVAPSGEKATPHRYIPHDKKDPSAIPECSNCHQPHPVPPPSPMAVPKASVDWCSGTCHHENNFTPCKVCHK